ncbi:MAG: antitoxin component YwqK of YwqJK toxin-antitoxin module [Cognaticolwellia sp.]|jgi:antitoxin component YwqK of YwqJK toxin-antitoxin module
MKNILVGFFILINTLLSSNILACNFGSTHPVLWHYNQTDKVFIGTVIKVGNIKTMNFAYREADTKIPTYKLRFVIHESYRGSMADTVDIGKVALAQLAFQEDETYLVYANYSISDGLLTTGSVLHVLDDRMSRHNILKEIKENPNRNIIEYNKINGEVWAEGSLENGEPVGEWNYYEITGELKEKGKYKKGNRHGKWRTYFVTDARFYSSFEAIRIGRAGRFKLVSHEKVKDPKSLYVYEIVYIDLGQSNKEYSVQYLYKNPVEQQVMKFKNGLANGKQKSYNDHGQLVGFQTFKKNKLDGKSRYIQIRIINDVESKTVIESLYKNGSVYTETVYYFENNKLVEADQTVRPN